MKKILIILIGILVVAVGAIVVMNQNNNSKELVVKPSLVSEQVDIESKLKDISGYTIDSPLVQLDPYKKAPLSGLIAFSTSEEKVITLTVKGKGDAVDISHTFDPTTVHYLPVYGLYADYLNTIVIKIDDLEYSFYIQTDALPSDFILPSLIKKDASFNTSDMYFVTPSNLGYPAAYDQEGEVRWYYSIRGIWDISRLSNGNFTLSTERMISTPYYNTGLYELDLMGKIYNEYSLPGGYHHDVFEMPNGNLLIASDDFEKGTVEDVIVEVDRISGEIVKKIDLKDILPQEDGKSYAWTKEDWFHNNSVWYDEETNSVILSGRHQDAVISVDYDTLGLNWIIGDRSNWSDDMQQYFFNYDDSEFDWQWSQHAAMVLPNGDIFILDNGNNRSKNRENYIEANDNYTRGVIYRINTSDMTIEQVYQYGKERGKEFYSPYISDVDYLADNHYLIHSGGIGSKDGNAINVPPAFIEGAVLNSITVEVLNGKVLFEMQLPSNFYRAEKMSLYHSHKNYSLVEAKRIGSLGITPIKEEKLGFTISNKPVPTDYQIEISQEEDRLNITGVFNKTDEVDIVLRENFKEYYYPILITDNQYTAMCVYLPNKTGDENKLNISKYINEEGLDGVFNLYIRINGVAYNTEYKVRM